jgi:hypothetical protein
MESKEEKVMIKLEDLVICYNWTGYITSDGFGQINKHGRSSMVSREIFKLYHKRKIKEGFIITHNCGNKLCMNPEHLIEIQKKNKKEYLKENKINPNLIFVLDGAFVYKIKYSKSKIDSKNKSITNEEKMIYKSILEEAIEKKVNESIPNHFNLSVPDINILKNELLNFLEKFISANLLKISPVIKTEVLAEFSKIVGDKYCIEADWSNQKRPSQLTIRPDVSLPSKRIAPARYVLEVSYGFPIPKGLVVRHNRDNPLCLNANHLETGNYIDNNLDRKKRPKNTNTSKSISVLRNTKDLKDIYDLHRNGESLSEIGRKKSDEYGFETPYDHGQIKDILDDYIKIYNLPKIEHKTQLELLSEYKEDIFDRIYNKRQTRDKVAKFYANKFNKDKIQLAYITEIYETQRKKRNLPPLKTKEEIVMDNIDIVIQLHEIEGKSYDTVAEHFEKKYTNISFSRKTISNTHKKYNQKENK